MKSSPLRDDNSAESQCDSAGINTRADYHSVIAKRYEFGTYYMGFPA